MSVGPVSGNGIAITLPPGKTVFWTANVQASWAQYVQVRDFSNNPVFQANGASTGGHSPTQIGQGTFVASGTGAYTVYLGYNNGQSWSQVMWEEMTLNIGSQIYFSSFNFIAEDGADQDFNDTCLTLTWFNSIG
ncbi:fucose-binding lectin II [Kosakonia sp. YIM B13605]|uniref:fucose-binding lectin II n=1 Tax=Kosakonia TaxID=1330547 RepID=UPI0028AE4D19|nr:fucose-binding lectin II [Kosakonia sacchari]